MEECFFQTLAFNININFLEDFCIQTNSLANVEARIQIGDVSEYHWTQWVQWVVRVTLKTRDQLFFKSESHCQHTK